MPTTRKYLNDKDVELWQEAKDLEAKARRIKADIRPRLKTTVDDYGASCRTDLAPHEVSLFYAERTITAWRNVVDTILDDDPELAERVSELIIDNSKPSYTYDIR